MDHHAADGREGLVRGQEILTGARPRGPRERSGGAGEEAARRLFAQPCRFVAGVASVAALPRAGPPEVAFAGRSNVGKSSLINALTGRRQLARISRTPGRTQQINFFALSGRLVLVDLPGYGYARASKRRIAAWTRLIDDYLQARSALRRVCLLIDARAGLRAADLDVMARLDAGAVSYQAVLTKTDKLGEAALAAALAGTGAALAMHGAAHPEIVATSARSKRGVAELRAALAGLAAPA